jgi:hypothetical protein
VADVRDLSGIQNATLKQDTRCGFHNESLWPSSSCGLQTMLYNIVHKTPWHTTVSQLEYLYSMSLSPHSSSSSVTLDDDDRDSTTSGTSHSTWFDDDQSSISSGTPAPKILFARDYPLKTYLEAILLPTFRSNTTSDLVNGRTLPWPSYKDMQRPIGTRGLQAVVRIDQEEFNMETSGCMSFLFSRIAIQLTDFLLLRLPRLARGASDV